jgi:hypothetical protein
MSPLTYPWFPYIFALGFPLTVYSHNQAAFSGVDVIRPVFVFLCVAALLVLVFRRVVKSRVLADVFATVPIILFWHLGVGWQFLLGLVGLAIVTFVFRSRGVSAKIISVVNALAVGVLLLPVIAIVQVERIVHDDALQNISFSPFVGAPTTQMTHGTPDIYHIVLDAYGGTGALEGELGFDNSEFFDDLRNLGFGVNDSIVVPYNETVHTMSSIFLGEYLRSDEFPIQSPFPSKLRSTLGALIVDGPVHNILRENDYSIVYTDPGHEFLRFPSDAVLLGHKNAAALSRFEFHLGSVSGLDKLLPELYVVTHENPLIRSAKDAFTHDFAEYASPKFAYQHVLAPHTPFIIDRYGKTTQAFPGFSSTAEGDRVVRGDPARWRTYVQGYLEKLRFVNDRVIDQVRRIQELPGEKIIVIHGDHGSGSMYFLDSERLTCLRERFTSFLAVYSNVPAVRDEFDWINESGATSVNIYRSMFNALLDLDLEMLPNRSSFVNFSSPHLLHPIDSNRITQACSSSE